MGLAEVLARHRGSAAPVLGRPLGGPLPMLDLTDPGIDPADTAAFSARVEAIMASAGADVAVGRYDEDRVIYRHSALFAGEAEPRTVHLGLDLFAAAGTAVCAPFAGVVHSFADNDETGSYGPTILLAHELDGCSFVTLYGHLSRASLAGLAEGAAVAAGERIGRLGDAAENGGWPPHLHFQLIADPGDWRGDFPGVCRRSERAAWLERCPDPDLVLGLGLGSVGGPGGR